MGIKEFKVEILKQEIQILVERINHLDDLRHRTRQLSITLWSAAMGFGLSQNQSWLFFAIIAFIPIPFWLQDVFYNSYQGGFELRFRAIRNFIRDGQYNIQNNQIVSLEKSFKHKSFGEFPIPDYYGTMTIDQSQLNKKKSISKLFFRTKMLFFYLPLVIIPILITWLKKAA